MSDIQERLLAAFQVEHKEHLQAVRRMLDDLARGGFDLSGFDFPEAHRRVHTLKGAARAVGLRPIEALAHRLESLMSRCQSDELALDREIVAVIHLAFDRIEDFVAALEQTAEPPEPADAVAALDRWLGGTEPAPSAHDEIERPSRPAGPGNSGQAQQSVAARPAETTRVEIESLDSALKHAGEVLTEALHHERITAELRALRHALEALERDASLAAAKTEITALLGRAREVGRLQDDATWRLGRLGRNLHRDVGALRIVSAESVFDGMGRMVRDLAQAEGKQIDVAMVGLDTRADRQVLQRLKDPVIHLLRNAVSHGIEAPEERRRRGKPAEGRIGLAVSTLRGRLEIRVEDDGGGLDQPRVIQEATRRGLLADGAGALDSAEALTRLLLQPGFSTARTVTEIAGRGFGLSIVDKAVRQLRGRFVLTSATPAGTIAVMSVPLAVAGSKVLLVRCGQNTYAIPAENVQALRRLVATDIATINGTPTILAEDGGGRLPLARLARLLDGTDVADAAEGPIPVVVLASEDGHMAVAVDAFVAVQDSVIHDLDPAVAGSSLAGGAVILADGSVSIVVNPVALVQAARNAEHRWSLEPRQKGSGDEVPLVLVVDDSITTRTLEKSILEARGFRVRLSVDGVDALEQLRQQRPNLVIADIEMPRMDGFALLHAMKGDRDLADIPVVLVTSRDDAQDRRKGLALGAEAYIVKQRFDQTELLETIDQIL